MDERLAGQIRECFENTLYALVEDKNRGVRDIALAAKLVTALYALNKMNEGEYSMRSYRRSYDGGSSNNSSNRGSYNSHRMSRNYSGHDIKAAMRDKLEELMDTADSDMDRNILQDMMNKIQEIRG